MPTDIQYKHELRKRLTEINRRMNMIRNKEFEKLLDELEKEANDIKASLEN